jgi:hypothetical protein
MSTAHEVDGVTIHVPEANEEQAVPNPQDSRGAWIEVPPELRKLALINGWVLGPSGWIRHCAPMAHLPKANGDPVGCSPECSACKVLAS